MLKKDLLDLIKTVKDDENVDELLINSELAGSFINLEKFKEKIEKDSDFKRFLDDEKKKHLEIGIESFKSENLQRMIDEKVKEMNPEDDPKDLAIRKMEQEIENMKKDTLKKELTNFALKTATEKKLPVDLVEFFVGADEQTTIKNIEGFEKIFGERMESMVVEKLKGSTYEPPSTNTKFDSLTKEDFFGLDFLEQQEFAKEKPEQYEQIIQ